MSSDERGMTGIGVLILFIALVLVAAIASGLILDTAGVLQNTAQNTGEQSTSEVSDRLSVLSASGDVQTVDEFELAASDSGVSGAADPYTLTVPVDEGESVSSAELTNFDAYGTSTDGTDITVTFAIVDENGNDVDTVTRTHTTATAADYSLDFSTPEAGSNVNYTFEARTGEASIDIEEIEVYNDVGDSNKVTDLGLNVYRSPGADDVDLQHATIEYFSPEGTAFLIHEDEYNALSAQERQEDFSDNLWYFSTEAVKDDDGSVPVLNSRDDRASVKVGLHNEFGGYSGNAPAAADYLDEGASATLRLTTQHGATTTRIVNVPQSLAGYDGSTVML